MTRSRHPHLTHTTTTRRRPALGAVLLAAVLMVAGCADSAATESAAGAATGAAADVVDDDSASTVSTDSAIAVGDNQVSHVDADDLEVDESDVVAITLDRTSATVDSGDAAGVTVDGSTVTIHDEGTYSFAGTLADGEIIVDAPDTADVTLLLEGVDIANGDGAAIAVMSADEAIVILGDGSTNRLTDGATYVFADAETDEPNAALYSAADLTIAGDGELVVTALYNDGIASKDGLAVESGTISVDAVDDGIRGKDYVIVGGGTIAVRADGDGIKADNDEDADRGYVQLDDGVVSITAGDDGIEAASDVLITGGRLTIDAGATSGTGRAIQADVLVAVSGGEIDATASDDAVHSNDQVVIDGGTLTVASGDDGIHGDSRVTINGGSITILESFEGIESEVIEINDGFIDITSSDDGINVAGADAITEATAPDAPGTEGAPVEPGAPAQPGARPEPGGGGRGGGPGGGVEAVGDYYVYINGGLTVITITDDLAEQGDGIDANGHVEMSGGVVVVSGPTDTRNSAVDYSGGSFVMTGGTFIGTNVDGRNSEGIGTGSSQASVYVTTGSTISAGTVVHIETTDGEGLVTFEPVNEYSVIVFSSPDLVDGESYDLYLGGEVTGEPTARLYEDSAYTEGELAGTATASSSR